METVINAILNVDCMDGLSHIESNTIDCVVTSPPYNKKGLSGCSTKTNQIWDKFTIDYTEYCDKMDESDYQDWMVAVINECVRVIKPSGSVFFNHKPRRHNNKCYLPTEFISRSDANIYQLIIWDRKNSPNIRNDILVPSTEHIYWLSKGKPKVFRNSVDQDFRSEVWKMSAQKQSGHPAPFPEQLVRNCVLLSTEPGDIVLDPFMGSGTTAVVSNHLNRKYIGFEIDKQYVRMAEDRLHAS